MNKDLLIERIAALCKEKGVNVTTAFEESGVGKNFRSNLKTSPLKYNPNTLFFMGTLFGQTTKHRVE